MSNQPGRRAGHIKAAPYSDKRLLDPLERISEVIFGLIMALTFTGTLSVVQADRAEVKDMLIGAIGCNIAWGLVDAVMYLVSIVIFRARGATILKFVQATDDHARANEHIAEHLPPVIASAIEENGLDAIREKLKALPAIPNRKLTARDFKGALGVFILVVLSTFPPVIPFLFISNAANALRVSNAVSILMMFLCGWLLARYAGNNKWLTGIIIALLGVALVLITIALGG